MEPFARGRTRLECSKIDLMFYETKVYFTMNSIFFQSIGTNTITFSTLKLQKTSKN